MEHILGEGGTQLVYKRRVPLFVLLDSVIVLFANYLSSLSKNMGVCKYGDEMNTFV